MSLKQLSRHGLVTVAAALASCLALPALAQSDFPSRPLNIVVPYSPGGSADALGRLMGERLQQRLGQPVIVKNIPGAGTQIGTLNVTRAPADGYNLLLSASTLSTQAAVSRTFKQALEQDLAPLTEIVTGPLVMIVNPEVPVKNIQELIAYSKANPKALNFGSTGVGSSLHFLFEYFMSRTGAQMTHVPFPGSSQQLTALLQGSVQLLIDPVFLLKPNIDSGKVRALGVTTAQRSPSLPSVPSIAEAGVPGFDMPTWIGLLGHARAPAGTNAKLAGTLSLIIHDADMSKRLVDMGFVPGGSSQQDFTARIQREYDIWKTIVRERNITIND